MYLTLDQVEELISENFYDFSGNKYQSRCFSGHYENTTDLPALALPGGDIGELCVSLAASIEYGFECNLKKTAEIIKNIAVKGRSKSFQHSMLHAAEECRYLHLLSENPEIYSLENGSVDHLFGTLEQSELVPKTEKKDQESTKENACIVFEGEKGILPQYVFSSAQQEISARVFIYHKSLVDERRKIIAKELYENNAVDLYEGLNDEYLYEVMSELGDSHLFETINKIDNKLPIYSASLTTSGKLKVEKYS